MSNKKEDNKKIKKPSIFDYCNISRRQLITGAVAGAASTLIPAKGLIFANSSYNLMLELDYSKCVGCHICELACSESREPDKVASPTNSRIHVGTYTGPVEIPQTCYRCGDYPCVESCPVEDCMWVDEETGAVKVDKELCIGCWICLEPEICPSQHIQADHDNMVVYGICDFCDGDPACAKFCPEDAITLVQSRWVDGFFFNNPSHRLAETVHQQLYFHDFYGCAESMSRKVEI